MDGTVDTTVELLSSLSARLTNHETHVACANWGRKRCYSSHRLSVVGVCSESVYNLFVL